MVLSPRPTSIVCASTPGPDGGGNGWSLTISTIASTGMTKIVSALRIADHGTRPRGRGWGIVVELISVFEHEVKKRTMATLSSGESDTEKIVDLREGKIRDAGRHKSSPRKT
ncbi:hypothetical protein Lesp02_82090 [Lentzea sp. NBRC 105346]|nr:hypothetical protein Lesp02_82090 [Lentzea sp. NBRC 105346]